MIVVKPGHVRFEKLSDEAIARLELGSQTSRDKKQHRVAFRNRLRRRGRLVDGVVVPSQ